MRYLLAYGGNDVCSIDVSVDEDESTDALFHIQFQFVPRPHLSLNVIATDMSFAQRIIDFVAETKGRPELRDIPLGGGVYRQVWQNLDLSASFASTSVKLMKYGEYDDHYVLSFRPSSAQGMPCLSIELYDKELDGFVDALSDVVGDL